MHQIPIKNLITQLFIWNFEQISVFQAATTSFKKFYQWKKLLKVVNNTLTIGLWHRWLAKIVKWYVGHATETNTMQILADWYSWQTWIIATHCSQKQFSWKFLLSLFNGPKSLLSDISMTLQKLHETIFVGYLWKSEILARNIFQNRHLFWDRDVLKTSHKRHLFWDVFEGS